MIFLLGGDWAGAVYASSVRLLVSMSQDDLKPTCILLVNSVAKIL
jgi:hypothetical protein